MEPTQDRPLVWTVRQVSLLLHCPTSEIYAMCRRGELPSIHLGRTHRAVRVPREGLESWLRARTAAADQPPRQEEAVPDRNPEEAGYDPASRSD